jgi:hypothetical protein
VRHNKISLCTMFQFVPVFKFHNKSVNYCFVTASAKADLVPWSVILERKRQGNTNRYGSVTISRTNMQVYIYTGTGTDTGTGILVSYHIYTVYSYCILVLAPYRGTVTRNCVVLKDTSSKALSTGIATIFTRYRNI